MPTRSEPRAAGLADRLADRSRGALRARYVFPVAGEPLFQGVVTFQDGRIVEVGRQAPAGVEDLGNVAILPGFINAHTHLEFGDLAGPLGAPGVPLTDWIPLVIEHRRQPGRSLQQSVRRGIEESVACGTTALGEIAQAEWPSESFSQTQLDAVVFLELIAPTMDRVPAARESARRHLEAAKTSPRWRPGLSPHAPYSVHPELLATTVSLSAAQAIPLAMHLAESPQELEWLQTGGGPLRDFLRRLEGWDPRDFPPGMRPLDYLRALARADRALVIHGNYLDEEEIAFLAERRERMAVVHCPRTHAHFGHAEDPLPRLLAAGATVALGTDSRASAPDLSVLAEMRSVARRHPTLPRPTVLALGTLAGARALGYDQHMGSLVPGKLANLTIVALPDRETSDPFELLFDANTPVVATMMSAGSDRPDEKGRMPRCIAPGSLPC